MTGITIVAIIFIWSAILIWLCNMASDHGWKFGIPAAIYFVLTFGIFVDSSIEFEKGNPCLEYETRMQFNPATKTTMPMKVCILRGEWVEETK